MVGKFIQQTLFADDGEIVAKQGGAVSAGITQDDDKKFMAALWEIMGRSTNHTGPWIEPTDAWSKQLLRDFLSAGH